MDPYSMDPAMLEQIPSLMPPEGVVPNFVDPESQAHIVAIVSYIALPLMAIFVMLRVYARIRIGHSFGADDILCLVSAASVAGYSGVSLAILGNPIGPHQWNVPLSKMTIPFLEKSLVTVCMYAISAMWVKSTLLVLYLRLFRPSQRANIMIWGGIIACTLFYVIVVVITLARCVPVSKNLPTAESQGECGQLQLDISAAQGVFSAAGDFYVLTIPISLVMELRLPMKRKIGVTAIFLTGLLACVCSVASAVYRFKQRTSSDFTWDAVPNYALSVAELNVGIICACLPVVFVLFKKSTQSGPWASLMRYIQTRRSRNRSAGLGKGESSDFSAAGDKMEADQLPRIPGATMTGLRSFIRKAHRTQTPGTVTVHTELSTYNELASIDDEYHAQLLKTGRGQGGYKVTVASPRGQQRV